MTASDAAAAGDLRPLLRKALRAGLSARALLAGEDYDGACDRAYNAMFNAARMLLILQSGRGETDTHQSTPRKFAKLFVAAGLAPAERGDDLIRVQALRAKADYASETATQAEAEDAVAAMATFLAFAEGYRPTDPDAEAPAPPPNVEGLVAARIAAREAKDFDEADRIRLELEAIGVVLMDRRNAKTGELETRWEMRR